MLLVTKAGGWGSAMPRVKLSSPPQIGSMSHAASMRN